MFLLEVHGEGDKDLTPVLGDLHLEAFYAGDQDIGGLKVPTRMSQKQVGMEITGNGVSGRANGDRPAHLVKSRVKCV